MMVVKGGFVRKLFTELFPFKEEEDTGFDPSYHGPWTREKVEPKVEELADFLISNLAKYERWFLNFSVQMSRLREYIRRAYFKEKIISPNDLMTIDEAIELQELMKDLEAKANSTVKLIFLLKSKRKSTLEVDMAKDMLILHSDLVKFTADQEIFIQKVDKLIGRHPREREEDPKTYRLLDYNRMLCKELQKKIATLLTSLLNILGE
jgi:hypothetical protein